MNQKAIVVYVDDSDKILTEFSWLYKTWKLYSLGEEFNSVVQSDIKVWKRIFS